MDHWILDQLESRCEADEQLHHQAYVSTTNDSGAVARAQAKNFYAGLTSRRLLLLATREGAFVSLPKTSSGAKPLKSLLERATVDGRAQRPPLPGPCRPRLRPRPLDAIAQNRGT